MKRPKKRPLSAAEKDANTEAWSQRISREGAPPHLLIFVQGGRISCSSNLSHSVIRLVLDTLGPQFEEQVGKESAS